MSIELSANECGQAAYVQYLIDQHGDEAYDRGVRRHVFFEANDDGMHGTYMQAQRDHADEIRLLGVNRPTVVEAGLMRAGVRRDVIGAVTLQLAQAQEAGLIVSAVHWITNAEAA